MNSNEYVPCIRYKLVIINFLEYYFYWREFKILKQFNHRDLIQLYFKDKYFPMKSEGKGKIKKGQEIRGKTKGFSYFSPNAIKIPHLFPNIIFFNT